MTEAVENPGNKVIHDCIKCIRCTFLAESSNILSLELSSPVLSRSNSSSLYSSRKETRTENSWTSCRETHSMKELVHPKTP